MEHLPLFADLRGRSCLVVGGGMVAERRAALLLEAGASVAVATAECKSERLRELAAEGRLCLTVAPFDAAQLEPHWLVIAATDDRDLNAEIARSAHALKRFCNVVDDPELCSFIMPAIVDRAPVTIAVSSGGRSPVLTRWVKGLIEAALPARLGHFAELVGRWRARVREALPDGAERRRFFESLMASDAAQHSYAGRESEAEHALEAALRGWRERGALDRSGEAYLVGAGPGSPDLITLRGRQLLASADAVLYDRLVNPALLAFARREAELICVGKTPHRPSITQKQLNRLLVRLVQSGKRVCRLKGGDPMVFGRGGEELEALVEAGLRFQVVPGVSAAEGCAAYAGIPLTLRGVSQAVLIATGHTQDDDARALPEFRPGQTLALYMGVAQYGEIAAALIARGHAAQTPVAVVESGTTDSQRVIRTVLGSLGRAQIALGVRPPALLVIGETTRLAERYSWFAPSKIEFFEAEPSQAMARVSY